MDDIITKLTPLFQKMGESIGQGASYGWGVVVRQQYITGIINLIFGGIFSGIFIAMLMHLHYMRLWAKEDNSIYSDRGFALGLYITGIVMVGIIIICCLISGFLHIFNPDYYAIKFFLNIASSNN